MATLNISLNLADPKAQALQDAINRSDPPVDAEGNPLPPRTLAQCQTWIRGRLVNALNDLYIKDQQWLRDQQAIDTDSGLT